MRKNPFKSPFATATTCQQDWLTLDAPTAIANGLWGWRWTGLARCVGPMIAALEPLPDGEEEPAHRYARGLCTYLSPDSMGLLLQRSYRRADEAVRAYDAMLPLLRAARAAPGNGVLQRDVENGGWAAEQAGQTAAKAWRTHALVSLIREDEQ